MAQYEVLEDLGLGRQLIRILTGDRAGMELVLTGHSPPGVRRLHDLIGEEAPPSTRRHGPYVAADRLLCSLLNDQQRSDWEVQKRFWVDTEFGQVQLGRLYNLLFCPPRGERLHLCVVPAGHRSLPDPDIWTNLLLALRADPVWFFKVANWRRAKGQWNFGPVPVDPIPLSVA